MSEILRLPGEDVEIRYPKGKLPKHDGKKLSIDDLRIFYTCINHAKRDDGSPLSKEEFRGIIGIKLGKPGTAIPITATKLGDPKYPWSKELAKSVERDEWKQELLLRVALLQFEWTERNDAARAASLGKINLKPYEQLPFLVLEHGAKSTQLREVQVQEIYAGMCWYEFEGKTLDKPDLRILTALLAGVKDVIHFRAFPRWVTSFIQGDNDPFTIEVRRAATLNKDALLRKVDAVWQHYLHPNRPIGYEVAGLMRARPSVSTSSPVVTGKRSQAIRSPVLSNRPEPTHRSTHHGHKNVGSAFDAPIPSPLAGGGGATGEPLSYPKYDHEYTTLGQLSESLQAQAVLSEQQTSFVQDTPLDQRPMYQQQGSYRPQSSHGLQSSFGPQSTFGPQSSYEPESQYSQQYPYRQQSTYEQQSRFRPQSSFGQESLNPQLVPHHQQVPSEPQSTFRSQSSFGQEPLYPQQVPYQQQAPSEPQSYYEQQQGYGRQPTFGSQTSFGLQSSFGPQFTYPQQPPVEHQPSYESESSYWQQFPQPALFKPQTPPNRDRLAPSEGKTPLSSSSGRTASPARATTKRQEEEGKSRRKTAQGGGQRKGDKDDGKKPKESRHKRADKDQDQAKKGHRSRPW